MIRKALPLVALAAVASLAPPATAAEIQIQAQGPVVELTVNEIVYSAPDVAQIGAGVQTRAPTAQEAVRQNAAAMEKVVARLRALGIDRKDIQTSNFNLNAQYDHRDGQAQRFIGYDVHNQVQVKLRNLERAGEVLDALVAAGANNIYGPNFMLEADESAKADARAKAFSRGRAMAQEYARMAGMSGLRLLEVSEVFQNYGRPMGGAVAMRMEASDAGTPIEPGEVGTGVNLTVKYEMTR